MAGAGRIDTPTAREVRTIRRELKRKPRAVAVIPIVLLPGRKDREREQAKLAMSAATAWVTGKPTSPNKTLVGELTRRHPRHLGVEALKVSFDSIKDGVLQGLGVKKEDHGLEIFWLHEQECSDAKEVVVSVWF